jgi:integral membrane protein (TIGR01906 family)
VRAATVAAVALAVPILLLAGAIWLLASPAWLALEYGRAGFPAASGFTNAERLRLATTSTLFIVRPGVDASDLSALTAADRPLYTEPEIAHLQDVKELIARVAGLAAIALAAIVAARVWARRSPERRRLWWRGVELGGWLTVCIVVGLALLAVVAWPFVFPAFHQVFFPPGTWQFDESSGLITLFPERFWYDSALVLCGLIAVGGATIGLGGWMVGHRQARG